MEFTAEMSISPPPVHPERWRAMHKWIEARQKEGMTIQQFIIFEEEFKDIETDDEYIRMCIKNGIKIY